jgi:hypothetical protein
MKASVFEISSELDLFGIIGLNSSLAGNAQKPKPEIKKGQYNYCASLNIVNEQNFTFPWNTLTLVTKISIAVIVIHTGRDLKHKNNICSSKNVNEHEKQLS